MPLSRAEFRSSALQPAPVCGCPTPSVVSGTVGCRLMKILQVCPKYSPAHGGVEELVQNVSERLVSKHEVTVFACDPSGGLPRQEEINGVLVRRFRSFSPGDAYHISLEMASALKKSRFDVVHGHNFHALPVFFSRYASRGKLIVSPCYHGHGHTPFRDVLLRLYRPLGAKVFADADAVVALSQYEKNLLARDFSLSLQDVHVIPSGVNVAEFAELGSVQREPQRILCVGRLEEYKGVQHVINALPLLHAGSHLDIVGSGPYKDRLVQLVANLGLRDRVSFRQDLPREQLLMAYARSGVFVLASQYESFSMVVAEALTAGTPCIVANTSALAEWVDGRNCFAIDNPANSTELAGLIRQAPGTRVEGAKVLDWNEVTRRMARLYEDQS